MLGKLFSEHHIKGATGENVGLDSTSDHVQLVLQSLPAGAGPGLGCFQRLLNFPETYFIHRHMSGTRCSHYSGPSRCTVRSWKMYGVGTCCGSVQCSDTEGPEGDWGMSQGRPRHQGCRVGEGRHPRRTATAWAMERRSSLSAGALASWKRWYLWWALRDVSDLGSWG